MTNKKYTLNESQMNFIASLRGHSITKYSKRKDRPSYRVRLKPREVELLLEYKKEHQNSDTKFPKILIFDVETAPLKAYVWRRWKQNISIDQTVSEWFMISWAAKWLDSKGIISECLTPQEIIEEDDKRIIRQLWTLFDEADIVIAHNGRRFDVPHANARFVLLGLLPPSPYTQIDTLEVVRKQFNFSSNKLDALAKYFGIENKDGTDFELWKKCMEGDQESLNYMKEYNKKDVVILEKIYLKIRPWIKNHPNAGLYLENEEETCPYCGSTDLADTGTFSYTGVSKFSNVRCSKCGGIARRRTSDYPKEKRKNLIKST